MNIEVIKQDDGLYHAFVDGVEIPVTSQYRGVARRNAAQWLREQAQKQQQAQRIMILKEVGL